MLEEDVLVAVVGVGVVELLFELVRLVGVGVVVFVLLLFGIVEVVDIDNERRWLLLDDDEGCIVVFEIGYEIFLLRQ